MKANGRHDNKENRAVIREEIHMLKGVLEE